MSNPLAIITGASRGIGKAISEELAIKGYDLVLNDILSLEEIKRTCKDYGIDVLSIQGDITDNKVLSKITEAIVGVHSSINLVNNAFAEKRKSFLELSDSDWEFTFNNTFFSSVKIIRAVIPKMREIHKGSIVNISSIHSIAAGLDFSPYDCAKSAMNALTRAIASEFGKDGIRCNSVSPGLIITDRNKDKWFNDSKAFNAVVSSYPLGRPGSSVEIAKAVSFLLSDDATFISGTNLIIDGGHLSQLPETTMLKVASRLN